MKTNAIVRIVLYSLLALMLTGVLLAGLLTNFVVDISSGTEVVVDFEASVDAASVQHLQIDWASGNVVVKAEDVDRIILRETADSVIKKPMTYRLENGTLELNHSNQMVFGPFFKPQEKNLVVIVPRNWECRELELDGAGLEVSINEMNIRELSIDGAGVALSASGSIQKLSIDGAGCEIALNCADRPKRIEMDGAGCVLSLTLPEGCGFTLDMDGLGCALDTDLPYRKQDGIYLSGDGDCQIDADGLGCQVSIRAGAAPAAAYPVRCGDDFTASLLLETPAEEYAPGTIIRLRTGILTDVDLELYVNGKFICRQTEAFSSDGTNHWEFYFTMPEDTAVIYFKTVDGILR